MRIALHIALFGTLSITTIDAIYASPSFPPPPAAVHQSLSLTELRNHFKIVELELALCHSIGSSPTLQSLHLVARKWYWVPSLPTAVLLLDVIIPMSIQKSFVPWVLFIGSMN
ncbi:hypothetical protein F5141DRAFT_1065654 [Pisolithus sp. B1]|nr:hypothetical protein F5141DRAFT_1065654 [Pisolithus sp. B1]